MIRASEWFLYDKKIRITSRLSPGSPGSLVRPLVPPGSHPVLPFLSRPDKSACSESFQGI